MTTAYEPKVRDDHGNLQEPEGGYDKVLVFGEDAPTDKFYKEVKENQGFRRNMQTRGCALKSGDIWHPDAEIVNDGELVVAYNEEGRKVLEDTIEKIKTEDGEVQKFLEKLGEHIEE